jgi:hypothetical protein
MEWLTRRAREDQENWMRWSGGANTQRAPTVSGQQRRAAEAERQAARDRRTAHRASTLAAAQRLVEAIDDPIERALVAASLRWLGYDDTAGKATPWLPFAPSCFDGLLHTHNQRGASPWLYEWFDSGRVGPWFARRAPGSGLVATEVEVPVVRRDRGLLRKGRWKEQHVTERGWVIEGASNYSRWGSCVWITVDGRVLPCRESVPDVSERDSRLPERGWDFGFSVNGALTIVSLLRLGPPELETMPGIVRARPF